MAVVVLFVLIFAGLLYQAIKGEQEKKRRSAAAEARRAQKAEANPPPKQDAVDMTPPVLKSGE